MTAVADTRLAAALQGVAGRVSVPGDDTYDAGRRAWQLAVRHHPAAVLEARSPGDVQVAVRAAREHGVPFGVMGTGHGAVEPLDAGLLLRTGALCAVHVDPVARTARVGAGAVWSDVVAAAEPYGLAPVCGTASSVGVAGYTLQGGLGWLSREHGFAADNLLEATVVTAAGQLVTASDGEHPDLFWALRGGGGGFGVVTSLTFRLHPVERVLGGTSLHPIERADDVLAAYRDWAAAEPDQLNTALLLVKMPDRDGVPDEFRDRWVLVVRAFATGDPERARSCLAPLLAAAGPPLADTLASTTFAEMLRRQGPPPPPVASTERVDLFTELSDGAFAAMLAAVGPDSDQVVACIELKQWGGALADPGPGAGPVSHRDTRFSAVTGARYDGRFPDAEVTASVAGLARSLAPHTTGGSLLTLLQDPGRTASAFTPTDHARLATVKQTWDPDLLFRAGHTIPPLRSAP